MADDENNALFGLDDSSLSFIDEGSAPGDAISNPSIDPSSISNDDTNWDFGTSQFDAFDPISTASTSQSLYGAALWDAPSFDLQSGANFDDTLGAIDDGAAFLFSGINDSSINQAPKVTARPKLQTPRQAITLSPAQQEKLRNIAMPPHLSYHSPNSASSPDSNPGDIKKSARGSPNGSKPNSKKRKIISDDEEEDDDDDEDKPVKKTSHNMIEKRYRNNLNDKIAALRDSVPSLRILSKSAKGEDTTADREELHGLTPAHKLNKATVLSKATEYIHHLEKRLSRVTEENKGQSARIAAFEKLFLAGAMNGSIQPPPTPLNYTPQEPLQHSFMSSPGSSGSPQSTSNAPAGMIQVPEDMKRIIAAQMAVGRPYPVPEQSYSSTNVVLQQQQLQQQQQQQQQQSRWNTAGPYFGKLMVGSLAGLMILEAVREEEASNESTDGRGLFALPVQLLSRFSNCFDFHIRGFHVHTSLKLLLLIGTVMWICIPSLFAATQRKTRKAQYSTLQAAPSPASPIQVRQQAWLTAVQSVWIPQRSFAFEAAALLLRTLKLSLCNLVGTAGYQMLTGLDADQETARIRAWSIALDSQLAGGDVEINNSRMVLTLMASGTLPDTPARLMLKALHIRIVLWNIGRKWHLGPLHSLAASLARSRWNNARQLNKLYVAARKHGHAREDELPEHLAKLVELECDDVLNHGVIQRAYNLAFNLKTTDQVKRPIEGMDAVVSDTAIGSPMDAVAAWWSTQLLHKVLNTTLNHEDPARSSITYRIGLAIQTAPLGTTAQARAVIAKAVFFNEHRGENIAKALETIGHDKAQGSTRESASIINSASHVSKPDMRLALSCAIAIAHLKRIDSTVGTPLQGLRTVEAMMRPRAGSMSLLASSAAAELMEQLFQHKSAAETFSLQLEHLAGSLRLWIGGSAGDKCGVSPAVRHMTVERCLNVTKSLVGMELDTGYGSLSEDEGESLTTISA